MSELGQPYIDGGTRLVGIVADPIHHVQTPQLMNRTFAETGTNAVIVPMHVSADELAGLARAVMAMQNMAGLIITVPHKIAAVTLCDELGEAGQMIGAVNAIRFDEGRMVGDMYDGLGFVQGLRNDGIVPAPGMRTYLAGAGGAARAIAFGLLTSGVTHLTIHNRSIRSAETLLAELRAHFVSARLRLGSRDASGHDLIINGTSAGLRQEDLLPFETDSLDQDAIVAEVIMTPRVTPLLAAAQRRGCRVVYGKNMLDAQIALLAAHVLGMPELRSWKPKVEE
jgi:shikimate dehydrogenase